MGSTNLAAEIDNLNDMIREFNDPAGIAPIDSDQDLVVVWDRLLNFQDAVLPRIYENERRLMVGMRQRVALLCLNKYAATMIKQFIWPNVSAEKKKELLEKRRAAKQLNLSSDSDETEEMDTSDGDEQIVFESKKRQRTD
jgi:hypothetical protein